MSKLLNATASLLTLAVFAVASPTVLAIPAGQIEGGDFYRVKNVTRNGAFADTIDADKCEVVQFKVRIHNPGPDPLTGVRVQATLPTAASTSHSSQVAVSATNANPTSRTDTAAVRLPAAYTISYEAGSTQLLDPNSAVIQNLPDGIVGNGVDVPGGVGVSLNQIRHVQFKAKVNCPEVPQAKFECKVLDVTKVDRTRFTFTARAHAENATIQSYTFTVRNSSGATVDTNTVNTSANSAVYNFNQSTPGTYTVSVIVKTDKGSTSVKDNCTKQIKVEAQPTTPVVQSQTTTLPDTGAGALLGVFAGASALGTAAHYAVRRYL